MNSHSQPAATRRQFLRTTTSLLGASALLPGAALAAEGAAAAAAPKRAILKGIMWGTIGPGKTVREKMDAAKAAGFAGVELMSHMKHEDVLAALQATGLKAASVCGSHHWAVPLSHPAEAQREKALEALKQTIRDAKAYGATSILLVPGTVGKNTTYEECWTRSVEQIKKAVPLAEELGVVIAIENVWNEFITDQKEAVRYLDAFNSPWVKWHFDVGNIIYYGDPIEWVKALGPRISRLHIKEYSRDKAMKKGKWEGFNAKFLEGANDWAGIMKALDKHGYTGGWGIAEQGGGGTPAGMKDLADRMDTIFAS